MESTSILGSLKKYCLIAWIIIASYAVFLCANYFTKPFTRAIMIGITVLCGVYFVSLIKRESEGRITGTLVFFHTVKKYRFLIEQLVSRDFKTKYKRSVLGILWSFLNPLLLMLVQYTVFSKMMADSLRSGGVSYYATYLLTGIMIFSGFQNCANEAMHAITGSASLITKVYVPKYIYPTAKVLSSSINLVLSMLPLFVVALINGIKPSIALVIIPIGLVSLILFTIGIGFLISSIVVFFRDIEFLWGVFTTLWMYATPIIYSMNFLPGWMQKLEWFNPMFYYISFMRTIIIDGNSPAPKIFAACYGMAVVMLIFGAWVFKKTEDKFILYL